MIYTREWLILEIDKTKNIIETTKSAQLRRDQNKYLRRLTNELYRQRAELSNKPK